MPRRSSQARHVYSKQIFARLQKTASFVCMRVREREDRCGSNHSGSRVSQPSAPDGVLSLSQFGKYLARLGTLSLSGLRSFALRKNKIMFSVFFMS